MNDFQRFQQQPTNLPPAGHERREVLKQRTDNLEQMGEQMYANVGAVSPEAFKPDHNVQNEIQRSGFLSIGVNHPLYITKWVNYVNQNSYMVWQAKDEGWIVATVNEFPEARDMAKVDGSIRVSDVILMFMRKDDHFKLMQRQEAKRLRQQFGVEADIHALAEQTNRREGRQVFASVQTPEVTTGGVSSELLKTMEARSALRRNAANIAARHLGNRMKTGTIPGVPIR